MSRRLVTYLTIVLSLLPNNHTYATEYESSAPVEVVAHSAPTAPSAEMSWRVPFPSRPRADWIQSVTMTRIPVGSLTVRYDGLHRVVLREFRRQCRQLIRRGRSHGWMFEPDDDLPAVPVVDRDRSCDRSVGVWWQRNWWESLPETKGGAPRKAFVHTYGKELDFRFGPITVTNTLKLKIDYLGLFELNPDPDEKSKASVRSRMSVDIRPLTEGATLGEAVRVKVKPLIQLCSPRADRWETFVREVALRFDIEIRARNKPILEGDCTVRWRTDTRELIASVEFSLASW